MTSQNEKKNEKSAHTHSDASVNCTEVYLLVILAYCIMKENSESDGAPAQLPREVVSLIL